MDSMVPEATVVEATATAPNGIHKPTHNNDQNHKRDGSIQAVPRADIAHANVWEWIHEIAAASPMQPIANLGTGFIEYNPPDFIIEEHRKALAYVEGNQYAPVQGIPALRDSISKLWSPYYDRTLNPDTEICVHNGAQDGLLSSMMAFTREGDEVILLEPAFEMYIYLSKLSGATAKFVPLRAPHKATHETVSGNDWTLDIEELERAVTPKTKALIFNNPHNPLGKVFTPDEIRAIGDVCVRHNILLIADEVYERIAYGSPFVRAATLGPALAARTLTAISLSKLFNATGWRVGFVIGPAELMQHVQSMHLTMSYVASSPAQRACVKGLLEAEENGFWESNCRDVQSRVDRVCGVLDEIGLPYVKPEGAYFVFVSVDKINLPADYKYPQLVVDHGTKDWKVCYYLTNELGVTSIPGTCFYSPDHAELGQSYIRLGVCKSDEGLQLARERLRKLKPLIA